MLPVEPRTFGTLISDSFSTLKRNSGMISKAIFYFWILPLIPLLLMVIPLIQQWPQGLDLENMNEDTISPEIAGLLVAIMLLAFVFALIAVVGYLAIASIAISDREDETTRLRDHLLPIIKGHMWWMILIFICTAIASELAAAPFDVENDGLGGMPYVLVSTVVTMFLGMKLYFIVPSLILESRGPLRAIERSWQLSKGFFWQTLGRYIGITLIGGVVVMIPFVLGLVITTIVVKSVGGENIIESMQDFGTMMTVFLIFLPTLILATLVAIIEPIFRCEVFYDLRTRKGEFDTPELDA